MCYDVFSACFTACDIMPNVDSDATPDDGSVITINSSDSCQLISVSTDNYNFFFYCFLSNNCQEQK